MFRNVWTELVGLYWWIIS